MLSIRKTLHSNQICLLQSMSCAEHTENSVPYPDFLLQSDLFAAINVVCEQAISYAEHMGNSAQQSDLFAAVNAVSQTTCDRLFAPVTICSS